MCVFVQQNARTRLYALFFRKAEVNTVFSFFIFMPCTQTHTNTLFHVHNVIFIAIENDRMFLLPNCNLNIAWENSSDWWAENLSQNNCILGRRHMIEASGLWVDPVLKNMWADLKWLIQCVVDFRESSTMWEKNHMTITRKPSYSTDRKYVTVYF